MHVYIYVFNKHSVIGRNRQAYFVANELTLTKHIIRLAYFYVFVVQYVDMTLNNLALTSHSGIIA